MTDERRSRERRVLRLGAAAILVILAGGRGLPILLEQQRDRHAAALRVALEATAADRSVRRLRNPSRSSSGWTEYEATLDSMLIHADANSFAGVALGQLVSDIATDDGVDLGSISARTDSTRGAGLVTVGIRTPIQGDLSAVVRFLSDLERGPETLIVRELTIAPQSAPAGEGGPTRLRGEIFVEALARIGESTTGAVSR